MRPLLPLLIATLLWSCAGCSAHPRELRHLPAFPSASLAATLAAAAFGSTGESHPLRDMGLLFLPILGVLTVPTILTSGSASLLPLGLVLIAALVVSGLALAWIVNRLVAGRR